MVSNIGLRRDFRLTKNCALLLLMVLSNKEIWLNVSTTKTLIFMPSSYSLLHCMSFRSLRGVDWNFHVP